MNFKKIISAAILKAEGGFSFSKMWIWLAGLVGFIVEINGDLVTAGISIPPHLLPYFKIAALASAIIAGIRLRTAASGGSNQVVQTPQVSPPNPPAAAK